MLGAKWHWYRYQFSVLRGAIHCHGLAKLQSDPDLCDLSEKAVNEYLAKKKLQRSDLSSHEKVHAQAATQSGLQAEESICKYYDYLISCCNPVNKDEWAKPDKHPCKVPYHTASENLDDDYSNLVNTVQRHSKCNSAYCLKIDSEGNQFCRFHYPFELQEFTHIKYNEISKKLGSDIRAEIVAKRNDSRVNRHQQIQLQGWRANCDIQLVIDHHACVEYLAKYAANKDKKCLQLHAMHLLMLSANCLTILLLKLP